MLNSTSMEKIPYKHVPHSDDDDSSGVSDVPESWQAEHQSRPTSRPATRQILLSKGLFLALLLSLTVNGLLLYDRYVVPWKLAGRLPSRFARLTYNIPTEIVSHNNFTSTNRTIQDHAWDQPDLEPWNLFLALDDGYSASMGLPSSQRWPWDAHKGAYIPMGAHDLHCVRVLRTVVNEDNDDVPPSNRTWAYGHAIHCLNVLRDSVMCRADDTPLYTGRLHKNVYEQHPRAGTGTIKMCRDWRALVSWAHGRSACYRPIHWHEDGFDDTERYKFCSDGSTPWKQGQASLGNGA